jgi:hypothetical protein
MPSLAELESFFSGRERKKKQPVFLLDKHRKPDALQAKTSERGA